MGKNLDITRNISKLIPIPGLSEPGKFIPLSKDEFEKSQATSPIPGSRDEFEQSQVTTPIPGSRDEFERLTQSTKYLIDPEEAVPPDAPDISGDTAVNIGETSVNIIPSSWNFPETIFNDLLNKFNEAFNAFKDFLFPSANTPGSSVGYVGSASVITMHMIKDTLISKGDGFAEIYMYRAGRNPKNLTNVITSLTKDPSDEEVNILKIPFKSVTFRVKIDEDPRLKAISISTSFAPKAVHLIKHGPEIFYCLYMPVIKDPLLKFDDRLDVIDPSAAHHVIEIKKNESAEIGMVRGRPEYDLQTREDLGSYYTLEHFIIRVTLFKQGPGSYLDFVHYSTPLRKSGVIVGKRQITEEDFLAHPELVGQVGYYHYLFVPDFQSGFNITLTAQSLEVDMGERIIITRATTSADWQVSSVIPLGARKKRQFALSLNSNNPLCDREFVIFDTNPIPSDIYQVFGHYNDVTILDKFTREKILNDPKDRPENYPILLAYIEYTTKGVRSGTITKSTSHEAKGENLAFTSYTVLSPNGDETEARGQYSPYQIGRFVLISEANNGSWYIVPSSFFYHSLAVKVGEGLSQ